MNDITKARFFLKNIGSDLQHLDSFALMLATAERRYKELTMKQRANTDPAGSWDEKEMDAALEFAALRFLKKNNRLPENIGSMLQKDLSLESKRDLAKQWAQ